jgi:exodeoxyribonuclease-3
MKGKPVVLIGDMNVAHQEIDIHDPKRNENMACFTFVER